MNPNALVKLLRIWGCWGEALGPAPMNPNALVKDVGCRVLLDMCSQRLAPRAIHMRLGGQRSAKP